MTDEEQKQLEMMARPKVKGRKGSHELSCKAILELQKEVQEIKRALVALLSQETRQLEIMNQFMGSVSKAAEMKEKDNG